MKLPIAIYGEDVLRQPGVAVPAMTDAIRQLVEAMLETMRAEGGVGLAAQQVGRTESVCVADATGAPRADELAGANAVPMPLIMINPRLTLGEGEESDQEGCLSFPEIFVRIKRAAAIDVRYKDMDWQDRTLHAQGFLARIIQHEIDHLNGTLLVDRMSPVQKVGVAGKLKRLKKGRCHPME